MRAYRVIAVLALAFGLPTWALAQDTPKGLMASGNLGLAVGQSFDSLTSNATAGNFGGQAAYLFKNAIGVEVLGDVTPSYIVGSPSLVSGRSNVTTYMFNVIGSIPLGNARFQPYASGGGGGMRMKANAFSVPGVETSATVGSSANKTAVNFGGGFIEYLKPKVGIRVDVRYYRASGTLDRGETGGLSKTPSSPAATADALLSGLDFIRVNFGASVRW
jgi:hypothetical protein